MNDPYCYASIIKRQHSRLKNAVRLARANVGRAVEARREAERRQHEAEARRMDASEALAAFELLEEDK